LLSDPSLCFGISETTPYNFLQLLTLQHKVALEGPLITILIVILVLMLIGALPSWPHSRNWGYRPVGGLGLILIIILILYMLGYV
jgi:VIT1/CCC1 family predicted Fe2+/Mn2+ transporter